MSGSDSIYLIMFSSGFLGGFGHCIGMCGPVVATFSFSIPSMRFIPHLLYNLGRVTTYTLMGGLMGFTGSWVGLTSPLQSVQKGIMALTGLVIIFMGAGMGGWLPFTGRIERKLNIVPLVSKIKLFFSDHLSTGTFFPLGIVLGFLPCGLVYTALITTARFAMETDNPMSGLLSGMLLMFSFGMGTVPALLLFGRMIHIFSINMRTKLYRIAALIMIVMGVVFVKKAIY